MTPRPGEFFRQMYLIQEIERHFLLSYSMGKIHGTVHTCLGQEAVAVGVMNAIDRELDIVFSNHRGHGHFIAYSMPNPPLREFICEVMARRDGLCGGYGGSQHIHWRNFYSSGIQGGIVPLAVGSVLAEKMKNSGAIVIVFIGDGTMGQGIVYENLNVASLWNLPILFVLENNQYAQTTRVDHAHAGSLEGRAAPFGIEHRALDGNDVELVFREASAIIHGIRKGSRPFFLSLETYRLGPHSKGDDFRPKDEIEAHQSSSPIMRLAGALRKDVTKRIRRSVESQVEAIFSELWRS